MKWLMCLVMLVAVGAAGMLGFAAPQAQPMAGLRFEAFDIFIDSGDRELGAYQVEIAAKARGQTKEVTLVGVEGGEHAAFKDAPNYDPAALHANKLSDRIILAAFNTGADLPKGKTRIARIHVQVEGEEPVMNLAIMAAASADGTRIQATATAAPAAMGESR